MFAPSSLHFASTAFRGQARPRAPSGFSSEPSSASPSRSLPPPGHDLCAHTRPNNNTNAGGLTTKDHSQFGVLHERQQSAPAWGTTAGMVSSIDQWGMHDFANMVPRRNISCPSSDFARRKRLQKILHYGQTTAMPSPFAEIIAPSRSADSKSRK